MRSDAPLRCHKLGSPKRVGPAGSSDRRRNGHRSVPMVRVQVLVGPDQQSEAVVSSMSRVQPWPAHPLDQVEKGLAGLVVASHATTRSGCGRARSTRLWQWAGSVSDFWELCTYAVQESK